MSGLTQELAQRLEAYIGDVDPSTRKGKKRGQILDAATDLFAEAGYGETSMDEIAAAAGVAKGTLYLYFPKKIDLLIACASREKLRWIPAMQEILTGTEPAQVRLKRWIVMILTLPTTSPLFARIMDGGFADIVSEMPPELLSDRRVTPVDLLGPMLDEIAGDHRWSSFELADRATVISALAQLGPTIRHDWARPEMSAQRFAALMADLIVDGLRPRATASRPPGPSSDCEAPPAPTRAPKGASS